MSNVAEYPAPAITGPAITNQQGLLDEWTVVKNGAGLTAYPDDSEDAKVRTAISVPAGSIFSQPWNK
jgi:hypothetical protein